MGLVAEEHTVIPAILRSALRATHNLAILLACLGILYALGNVAGFTLFMALGLVVAMCFMSRVCRSKLRIPVIIRVVADGGPIGVLRPGEQVIHYDVLAKEKMNPLVEAGVLAMLASLINCSA